MIEFIFTIDYEVYGNGEGSLKELVFEPAKELYAIFKKWKARFVLFAEAAELEVIGRSGADPFIEPVERQIRDLWADGFEIGLHLHPQWYNARRKDSRWYLDYSEYNLSRLPQPRIEEIVGRSLGYLKNIICPGSYQPLSFRAGNWLLQPTKAVAESLVKHGIKVDSSVFKGGVQHEHGLDYRRSSKLGYFWKFADDVNVSVPEGALLEIPTFTKMVPIWRMATGKRAQIAGRAAPGPRGWGREIMRLRDFFRMHYPMKLDFCRLTPAEIFRILDVEIREDKRDPSAIRPIVAIGHTKDLVDFETVTALLAYLQTNAVPVSTFREVYSKINGLGGGS